VKNLSCFGCIGCCVTLVGLLGCQPSAPRNSADNNSQSSGATPREQVTKPAASQPKAAKTTLKVAATTSLQSILPVLAADFAQMNPQISLDVHYDSSIGLYETITSNKKKFDIYLSGNQVFPKLLYQQGYASNVATSKYGKPFTYTRGQLVLYSSKHVLEVTPTSTLDNFMLDNNGQMTLAIANPQITSYGVAAENWLINQNLYQSLETNLIYKKSIDEVFQSTDKGEVDFGLVGLSQILAKPGGNKLGGFDQSNHYTILPKDSYPAIYQDAIVLDQVEASDKFVQYLLTARAQDALNDAGYLPICTSSNLLPACK
jgi:molybdate transport system substrate-binding protein